MSFHRHTTIQSFLTYLKTEESIVEYVPRPIDTAHVQLSAGILELTEHLAENAHDIWAAQRLKDGLRP